MEAECPEDVPVPVQPESPPSPGFAKAEGTETRREYAAEKEPPTLPAGSESGPRLIGRRSHSYAPFLLLLAPARSLHQSPLPHGSPFHPIEQSVLHDQARHADHQDGRVNCLGIH